MGLLPESSTVPWTMVTAAPSSCVGGGGRPRSCGRTRAAGLWALDARRPERDRLVPRRVVRTCLRQRFLVGSLVEQLDRGEPQRVLAVAEHADVDALALAEVVRVLVRVAPG